MSQHVIHVGSSTFYQGGRRTQEEWEAAVRELIETGRPLVACDLARTAMELHPTSTALKQLAAQALTKSGALEEARELLEPMCNPLRPDRLTMSRLYTRLRDAIAALATEARQGQPVPDAQELVSDLFEDIARAIQSTRGSSAASEESLGLLGRVYKDLWQRKVVERDPDGTTIDFARKSYETYLRGFRSSGGIYTGINAAAMARLVGDGAHSVELARQVLDIVEADHAAGRADYWSWATLGEAYLLLGAEHAGQCAEAYRHAASLVGERYAHLVSSIRQLRLYQREGVEVPAGLIADAGTSDEDAVLRPPSIVVFVGHMIDQPGQEPARFPVEQEHVVREHVDRALAELGAQIGYSSAACGSDIIFIEAMLSRGAEVNIVLPFHVDDFVETSVRIGGPDWVRRFHRAVRLANGVKYATEERSLGDANLFAHGARVAQGLAQLRAQLLETDPVMLAVHDGSTVGREGGTSDQIAKWPETARRHIIPLCEILGTAPQTPECLERLPPPFPARLRRSAYDAERTRAVKTLLFADVVGYSKLEEDAMPFYMYEFLRSVAAELEQRAATPITINTWGDAIFVVMNTAQDLATYAIALQRVVRDTNWTDKGLSSDLNLRIALHAGPVFTGTDPMTGMPNHYGSHVNRAARIEPVTRPGSIYASEQFVTLLAAETAAASRAGRGPYRFEYVGTVPLAKKFGTQALYQLRAGSA